jgi:hypothetical protein
MSFEIKLSEITVESLSEAGDELTFEVTPYLVNLVHIALIKLQLNKRIMTYGEVFGDDVQRSADFRNDMSCALYLLWCWCEWNEIGLLNFLIVSSKSGLPGNGVKAEYKRVFGTDKGFEDWCLVKASEALLMLEHDLVKVVLK